MTSRDLMLAVLSMDAYLDAPRDIGDATFQKSELRFSGFFAASFSYQGQTVVAFRGTNDQGVFDAFTGYGTYFGSRSTQAVLAANLGNIQQKQENRGKSAGLRPALQFSSRLELLE